MDQPSQTDSGAHPSAQGSAESPARAQDALYQGGRLVAKVTEVEIDLASREVRFGEVSHSEDLLIPEECEFRGYRILIQRIAYATKIQRGEEHKGRVLRGVTCDLLGYLTP
jgi:hypothetical protein